MVNFSTPPGLEGLLDLDRKGVDIRPTLLRVLTDQYLLSPTHTPDEERHYTELAMRLIDETDIPTRQAVASRLAPHACAPRSIMLQLARDMLDIAEPVLRHSPVLTPADCEAIIAERGPLYGEIIAQRGRPTETAAVKEPAAVRPTPPLHRPTPSPALEEAIAELKRAKEAFQSKAEVHPKPETGAQHRLQPQPEADSVEQPETATQADELCELFFAAGSLERRLILINLDFATWEPSQPPTMLRAEVWQLETSALKHNTSGVIRELERALSISNRQARRIVEDEQGEPIVVAAKAMRIPADVLQRILLFMNPRIGQSVDRVYELAALYNEISVEAACRLIAILRAADGAVRDRERHAWHSAAETARRALSEITTTATPRRNTPPFEQKTPAKSFGR
jgi:hypothetical protein